MNTGPVASRIGQAAQQLKNNPMASQILNPPVKNIVLPGLLLGNMAYKLGTEKDPQKRNDVMWNSLISWLGGVLLTNRALPYYVLPGVAGSIALFKIAQKDTAEEKKDTAINHAAWWLTGIATQAAAKVLNLKSAFSTYCAFAVGASVFGPLVAHFVKQKILPPIIKNQEKTISNGIDTLTSGYPVGQKANLHFSPFNDPANGSPFNHFTPTKSNYDPTDPYNLKKLVPRAFFK